MTRYLRPHLESALAERMVFVAGPRRVGKTTLAKSLSEAGEGYLDWDRAEHREQILRRELPPARLWVFDEIHKYRSWRNYLKGIYDGRAEGQQILVAGSARLDPNRYSDDSLQGRYHLLRLHPLSAAEVSAGSPADLDHLSRLGGFPEPFFGASDSKARQWSREYRERLIREDVIALERTQDLGNLELLLLRLPDLVGSPLSINALRQDLQLSHKTVANWLRILERHFFLFRLSPFGAPRLRAIKKAQKHYHFDWSLVTDHAARFENLVASHLLKWVHYRQDTEGLELELRYFRDTDGREVDFVVADHGRPILLVEPKVEDTGPDRSLRYLARRFPEAAAWQLSASGTRDVVTPQGIRLAPALTLLRDLV